MSGQLPRVYTANPLPGELPVPVTGPATPPRPRSRFVPSSTALASGITEEDRQSTAFQLGVCQSLIEQVITGTLSAVGLRDRYTAYYPEWEPTS